MGDLSDVSKTYYLDRINRAIDHITQDLSAPLKLEEVARVACFSPYHFHRIFRGLIGETLHEFVTRLRLERALYLMSHDPRRRLTEIALACGFGSGSDFSRSFRQCFGKSPRAFDVKRLRQARREEMIAALQANHTVGQIPARANARGFTVQLRKLPARRVAYLRVFRPYESLGRVKEATRQLMAWARERGLARGQWLGYQWEDPQIVPLERCRYDVGVEVPETAALNGAVHEARFPSMTVAELDFAGSLDRELLAIEWLYTTWLPQSGFVPDHQPGFEVWNGEPFGHGDAHFELRLQLPVVDIHSLGAART